MLQRRSHDCIEIACAAWGRPRARVGNGHWWGQMMQTLSRILLSAVAIFGAGQAVAQEAIYVACSVVQGEEEDHILNRQQIYRISNNSIDAWRGSDFTWRGRLTCNQAPYCQMAMQLTSTEAILTRTQRMQSVRFESTERHVFSINRLTGRFSMHRYSAGADSVDNWDRQDVSGTCEAAPNPETNTPRRF